MATEQCKWGPCEGGGVKCPVCGAWRTKRIRRVCRPGMAGRTSRSEERPTAPKSASPPRSSILRLAWRYLIAQVRERIVAKWHALPQRVIDERLAICKACPHYAAARHRCKLCGCCGGSGQSKWLNKLALASEECPDNPPRWGKYEAGLRRLTLWHPRSREQS